MERHEDEKLWDLLGIARADQRSAFFARNVVRTIRQTRRPAHPSLRWQRFVSVGSLAAVALGMMLAFQSFTKQSGKASADDAQLVVEMDEVFTPPDEESPIDDELTLEI